MSTDTILEDTTRLALLASAGQRVGVNAVVKWRKTGLTGQIYSDDVRSLAFNTILSMAKVLNMKKGLLRTPYAAKIGDGSVFVFSEKNGFDDIEAFFDVKSVLVIEIDQ